MLEADKQGSIFKEMADRRSRSEELQAKAVEHGLAVGGATQIPDAGIDDPSEIELSPAFDMEDLQVTPVSENEIQVEDSNPSVESLDTPVENTLDELVIDNPPEEEPTAVAGESASSDAASIFDELENDDLSNEEMLRKELAPEFVPISERDSMPELETQVSEEVAEPESVQEEATPLSDVPEIEAQSVAAPSYFDEIDSSAKEEMQSAETEPEVAAEAMDATLAADLEPDPEPAFAASEVEAAAEPEPLTEPSALESLASADNEKSVVAPSYFDDIGTPDAEVSEQVEMEAEPEAIEVSKPEPAPEMVEDLIGESEDLLAPSPEAIEGAEALMAAEALVDRIGQVVDIQSLPKTQPSRVLSKTMKAVAEASVPVQEPAQKAPAEVAKIQPPSAKQKAAPAAEEGPAPKKKKKKVSLLDSYFKGL